MRAQMFGAALRGGRSGIVPSISDELVESIVTSSGGASAWLKLESDGDTIATDGARGDWLIGSVTGSAYECRATIVSGTASAGSSATGSWLALSSDRTWFADRASLGSKTFIFDLEIGLSGANSALDTARITLTATVEL